MPSCNSCEDNKLPHRRGRSSALEDTYCRMPNSSNPEVAISATRFPKAKAYEYSPDPAGPKERAMTAKSRKLRKSAVILQVESQKALLATLNGQAGDILCAGRCRTACGLPLPRFPTLRGHAKII
jgi:hypothetical protein